MNKPPVDKKHMESRGGFSDLKLLLSEDLGNVEVRMSGLYIERYGVGESHSTVMDLFDLLYNSVV